MSEFPSLAEVLATHQPTTLGDSCRCGAGYLRRTIAEHQAQAWRAACTITTVEQLDALPFGALIRGANGRGFEMTADTRLLDRPWFEAGNSSPESHDRIPLPALLIWHPDWSQP